MRDIRHLVIIALALAFSAAAGWAASDLVSDKSVCVFPLVDTSTAHNDHQKPFSEAVRQEFEAVGFRIVPQEKWALQATLVAQKPDRISDPSSALEIARGAGADMAVAGSYQVSNDRVLVSVQCYDVTAGTLISGFSHTWRFNLGFYNSLHAQISDLIQRVVFSKSPRLIAIKDGIRVDQITFTSTQEGMEVVVEGQENVGRIQGGSLVFTAQGVKAGTLLRIEKRQEGYHTVWQEVRAAPQIALTPIPKKNHFAVEAEWTAGEVAGAGVGLRWYPVPDWFFLGLSEYLFTQVPTVSAGTWPFHSDSTLLLGLYLFLPPQSPFRMGIATGGGIFLTALPDAGVLFTDVYANLLDIFFELRAGNVRLFARAEGKLTLGIGNNLLGSRVVTWNSSLPPFTFGVVIPW